MKQQRKYSTLFVIGLVMFRFWPQFGPILAKVRDKPEILLAPALDVFQGSATNEELYFVSLILVVGGLIVALLAANFTWLMHNLTLKLLLKIFGLWLIFASAVSIVTLSVYLTQQPQQPLLQAEQSATPRKIKIRFEPDKLIVTWQTDKPTTGQLSYTSDLNPEPVFVSSNHNQPTTHHQVEIPRKPGMKQLRLTIFANGIEYRLDDQPLLVILPE